MKRTASHILAGWLLLLWGESVVNTPPAAAQAPKDPSLEQMIKSAEELVRNGDKAAARKKYEEALKNNPSLPPAELWLSKLEFAAKRPWVGRDLLETAMEKHPEHPECFLFNSSIAFNEGRVAEGITNCQMALNAALLPRWTKSQSQMFQTEAYNALAGAYESRGDWIGTAVSLESLSKFDPKNAQLLVRLARARFLAEREKDALDSLKLAKNIDPNVGIPEVLMAQFQSQKSYRPSRSFRAPSPPWIEIHKWINDLTTHERFEKALKLYPDQAQPALAYAAWLLDIGQLADAKKQIDRARWLKPNTVDAMKLRHLLEQLEKYVVIQFVSSDELLATMKTIVIVEAGQPAPNGKREPVAKVDIISEPVKLPSQRPFDIWLLPKHGIPVRVVRNVKLDGGAVTEIELDRYLGIVNVCGDTHPPASLITVAPQDDPGPGEIGHKAIQVSKVYCVDMVVPQGVYSLWITPENGGKSRKIGDSLRVQAGKTVHQD